MLQYNPSITGSLQVTGSLLVTGNEAVSGSLTVLGGIIGAITGSATSASYAISASEASTLQGLGSASFAPAATFNTVSQSYASASGSLSTRVTANETNIATLTSASASFATMSGSLSTRVTNLEATSSTVSQSFASTSGSISSRVTLIEGQYATTGSNNFTKPQQISDVSNAISFTSTASLYTEGGLRVKGSSFISGTAYFNDVVVYGTSSIEYITSSQIAIGTNIITLNTDTPSIRYGGISVFDSGSNNLSTGSLFWDSEKDKWIYSNPSGSTYDGGMLISGPRNTSGLGNEVGTTSCALMMGQGGDHITSSAIFSYGNATCFYGQSYISSSGNAYFAGNVGIGTTNPSTSLGAATVRGLVVNGGSSADVQFRLQNTNTGCTDNDGGLFSLAGDNSIYLWNYENAGLHLGTNNTDRLFITAGGCVGIGTINPTYQLQVTSATPSILLEATGSTGPAYLRFNNTTRSSTNYIALGGTTNDLFFTVNGADRFFISGSGNIGIGTTQPNRSLTIQRCTESWIESITTQTTTQCWLFGQDGTRKGFEVYDVNLTATRLFVAPTTGYVGISNVCPNSPLSFSNGTGNKIDFYNDGITRYSAQINSGELRFYTCGTDYISLYAGNTAGLVNRSGKVVISGTCTDAVFSVGDWCNRGGRLLTSNCSGWYADGVTPCSIIVTNNAATCKGTSIGLVLHNDNQATSNWTPSLVFSRRSYSGIYNSAIASIQAQTLGCGNDANWNGGDLVFSVNPVGGYMGENLRLSANYACFSGTICAFSGVRFASGATSLNYFEEGIWQPVLRDSNSGTVANDTFTNAGRYTRIGNRVFFALYSRFGLSGIGSGDGGFTANLRISLPFTACSTSPSGTGENFVPVNISYWSSFYCLNSGDFPSGYVRNGENNIQLTLQNVACFGEFTFGTSRLTRSSSAGIMIAGHYYAS